MHGCGRGRSTLEGMDEQPTLREMAGFLVGAAEIAELLRVHPNTINAWKVRDLDFPLPIRRLRGLDIWDQREVLAWARRTNRYPPRERAGL